MQEQMIWVIAAALVLLLLAFFLYRALRRRFQSGKYVIREEDRLHITLESGNLTKTAEEIFAGLGGKENLAAVQADGTRLKLMVRRYDAVDEKRIRQAGAGGVLRPSKTAVHVIVGESAKALSELLEGMISG